MASEPLFPLMAAGMVVGYATGDRYVFTSKVYLPMLLLMPEALPRTVSGDGVQFMLFPDGRSALRAAKAVFNATR